MLVLLIAPAFAFAMNKEFEISYSADGKRITAFGCINSICTSVTKYEDGTFIDYTTNERNCLTTVNGTTVMMRVGVVSSPSLVEWLKTRINVFESEGKFKESAQKTPQKEQPDKK